MGSVKCFFINIFKNFKFLMIFTMFNSESILSEDLETNLCNFDFLIFFFKQKQRTMFRKCILIKTHKLYLRFNFACLYSAILIRNWDVNYLSMACSFSSFSLFLWCWCSSSGNRPFYAV